MFTKNKSMLALLAFASVFPTQATTVIDQAVETRGSDIPARPTKYIKTLKKSSSGQSTQAQKFAFSTMATASASGSDASQSKVMSELALSRIGVNEEITPETTELFGDKVDLSSGGISLSNTDVSIPGNFPIDVGVQRVYRGTQYSEGQLLHFADWQLDIPAITTTVVDGTPLTNTWTNGKPCSGSLNPGSIQTSDGYAVSQQFWSGDFISVPGAGTERLLEPTTSTPGVTRIAKGWKIECVMLGNQEGFKATNSAGITYTFSKLRLVPAEDIEVSVTDPETKAQWSIRVPRYNAFMQVTQINDRFGNTVNYNYSSPDQLDSITTSDGRTVSFAYELGVERKRIRSITANGQTWQYFYRQSSTPKWINNNYVYPDQLSRVVLPDGREWTYNVDFAPVDALKVQTTLYTGEDKITGERQCSFTNSSTSIGSEAVSTYTSSIKHPNGMVATFEVKPTLFGRSKLPKLMKSATVPLNQYPRCFANFAISKKTLSGKGVPTLTWNYSYSQNPGQYVDGSGDQGPAPAGLSGLPVVPAGYVAMDLKSTTVVSPDGAKTVHVFDRSYTFKQDQEVATFQYDTDGITLLQRAEHSYAVMSTGGTANMFTQKYLGNAAPGGGFVFENEALYNNYANKSESKIVNYVAGVPSDTYTTQLSNYNSYGVPGLTKEFNSFSSKVKFTRDTYIHDLNNFVLNLLQKKEISADGSSYTAVAETTYHSASSAAKSLPNQQYSFGQLVSTTSYHPDGNVKQQTFNVANRWIYLDNYKRGKPQTIRIPRRYDAYCTDPASCYEEIRATINDTGTIAWTRDLNGNETYYSYDVVGRLTTIDPYDARWSDTSISYSLDYSTSAALIQTIARGDYRKTVTLDGLMRPILTKEWDVNDESGTASYVRREFNAYNKPTFESVPSEVGYESVGSATIFDGLQRPKSQTNTPNGDLSFSYLANNSVRVTNGRGYATTTQYLAYGSATQEAPVKITQPESVTTDITYNIFDNVTAITQGGITENRLYNAQQLMCLQKRPETGIKAMTYNAVGEITQYAEGLTGNGTTCSDYGSNASAWVSIGYDNQGAQKSINFADGTAAVNYTLDAQGNLKNLTNGTVAWDYDYNSKNLVEWERLSIDGKQFTVDATYNALGFVSSEQLSNELTLSYIVNARGQVTQVSDGATLLASGATYYPNGQLKSFNYGNAMVFSQTLDAKKRPYERIVSRYGTNQLAQRYQYDVNDNVTAITDLVNAGSSVGMSYDGLDRLSTANGAWGNGSFSYDVLSNIKTKTVAGTTYSYTYDTTKNRLASVTGGYSFGYDDRGNVTNNGKRGFSFNRANQLVQSASVSYVYDGYNRRVRQSNASGNHYSVYDAKGTLKQRLTSANARVYSVYLGKQLIAERELSASSNTTRYQHTDVLGSAVGESDSAAALTRSVYQPFGERLGGQKSGVGFTGHLEDPDVGLTYMQQRYYDPVIGRFYSNDSVGFTADNPMMFNRYAYANNNPYKYVDPDGNAPDNAIQEIYAAFKIFPNGGVSLPTGTGKVTSHFNPGRLHPVLNKIKPHRGTDFEAPFGASIFSTEKGTVLSIGYDKKYGGGNQIWIQNDTGSISGYSHTGAIKGLAEGASVYSGQTIGSSDNSGRLTGAHLHYTYIPGSRTNPATMNSPRVDATSTQLKGIVRVSGRIHSKKLAKGN